MSLLGRYIRHAASGTGGATDLVAANNPWGAGRSTILRANAQHLVEASQRRALWTSTGVEGFYRAARGGTLFTSAPTPTDIDWRYSRKTGGLALFLGTHYAWRSPLHRWPRLAVRFQAKVASTYTLGVVLAVAPGVRGPLEAVTYLGATYTDTSFTEQEIAFNLSDACFERAAWSPQNGIDPAPLDEWGDLQTFSVYLGGYCSSDSGSGTASVVGIALATEPAS